MYYYWKWISGFFSFGENEASNGLTESDNKESLPIFPLEIWHFILSFLKAKDRLKLMQVNKTFYWLLYKDENYWKRICDLSTPKPPNVTYRECFLRTIRTQKKTYLTSGIRGKVILFGELGVGKTTFFHSLQNKTYSPDINSIACFISRRTIRDDYKVIADFWDTAGQERYGPLVSMYFRGTDIILSCFDLTQISTLDYLKKYPIHKNPSLPSSPFIFLIGLKKDALTIPTSDIPELIEFKKYYFHHYYFEVSSKNINELENVLDQMLDCIYIKKMRIFSQ